MKVPICISGIAVSSPPFSMTQSEARTVMMESYGSMLTPRNRAILARMFNHPSIQKRHFAMADPFEAVSEDQEAKIARFTRWAVELSVDAARKALTRSGLTEQNVAAVIVNTCTGYICPGLSSYISESLGLASTVKLYDLVGAGCGGAIPNLQLAGSLAHQLYLNSANADACILSISVEICTATFQMGNDVSLIVSNAIFGDGASAAVVQAGRHKGLEMIYSTSYLDASYREDIRYVYRNGQLHNQLSTALPGIAGNTVKRVVDLLLEPLKLKPLDVPYWAMHSGGEKVIESVRVALDLPDDAFAVTREVLRDFGNMSSPSAMFALDLLFHRGMSDKSYCALVGFGAGMSAHAYLLKTHL